MTSKVKNIREEDDTATSEFEKARESAREAWANFVEARRHMQSAAVAAGIDLKDTANEQFDETLESLKATQEDLMEQSTEYIRNNPLKSTGMAFVGGYLLSRILR